MRNSTQKWVSNSWESSRAGRWPNQEGPELTPQHLSSNSKWCLKARRAAVADFHGGALWGDVLNQIAEGMLGEEGELVRALVPQMANPAFRVGARPGRKLGAVDDPERGQANRAAAVPPRISRPGATSRRFSGLSGSRYGRVRRDGQGRSRRCIHAAAGVR